MSKRQPAIRAKYWKAESEADEETRKYFISWAYITESGERHWMYTDWQDAAERFDQAIEIDKDPDYDDEPITQEEAYMAMLEVQARRVLGGQS